MKIEASLQPAYVLHARPYRETSLLLEGLSLDYGKIALVARGVRGKKKSTRNLMQPFTPLLISWISRGELGTLVNVDKVGRGHNLHGNRLASGFYINELIVKLTARNDPHPSLFNVYQDTLRRVEKDRNIEVALRQFEKKLLDELGYGMNLDYEIGTGEALQSNKIYRYRIEEGAEEIHSLSNNPTEVSGTTLIGLRENTLSTTDELREAKSLLRIVLQKYLGNSQIRSRELLTKRTDERRRYDL